MVQPTGSLWEQLDDWVLPNFVTAVRVRVPQGRGREPKGTEGKPWMLQMYGSFHSSHSNTANGFL
ncbi:unnamed protein product [Cladocopium goreaui]|uniref:Uncharacterized protein n=1 Tax=Cladocopium goreaui TaxID=2562237 RepID=A0A9P1D356_9DINO|nr:unnamed protein product [Cladocopium goreaui]